MFRTHRLPGVDALAARAVCAAIVLICAASAPRCAAAQSNSAAGDIAKPSAPSPGPLQSGSQPPPSVTPQPAAAKVVEPADPKARKTYAEALEWQKQRRYEAAVDDLRKANKQDGGRCRECLNRAYMLAMKTGAWNDAAQIAMEMLPQANDDVERAAAHYRVAMALQKQGVHGKKEKCFSDSCDELKTSLTLAPALTAAHYALGISLANLHQDDAARKEFAAYLQQDKANLETHERVERYIERIDLARATMAPPFSLATLDGRQLSLDSLAGKVVLIDFWATWCGPCRQALPHIRDLAKKFEGKPFIVLSISLDKDEDKWRSFVAQNGMTWLQYRDGGFDGSIARMFGVTAIPATFTIDADGVLEDQHVGDAEIEGKIKKLVAHAIEAANRKSVPESPERMPGSGNE